METIVRHENLTTKEVTRVCHVLDFGCGLILRIILYDIHVTPALDSTCQYTYKPA